MLLVLLSVIALAVSAERFSGYQWTIEIPDRVMGRKGKPVVLFCKFTHPYHRYSGNITISWREEKTGKVLLKYINYPLKNGSAEQILVNVGERYQPMGNPRENNASIIIKKLKQKDTGKKFKCRVDLTEEPSGKVEWSHGALEITGGRSISASSVIGKRGDSATLPCSFSPPDKNPSSITILWMKGNPREESIVFNHTRSHSVGPLYTDAVNEGDRYELVGNPDQGDVSIRVRDLGLNDTSDYYCHVWVRSSKWETVTQDETRLQVVVPATILELSVVTDNVTGDTLVCRAEGELPVNITWIGPGNSALPVNASETRVTRDRERHQSVGELLQPRLRGSYSCVAVNEHGRDAREIHLPEEKMSALKLAIYIGLSTSAVVLLATFALCAKKKDSQQLGGDPIYSVVDLTSRTGNAILPQAAPTPGGMDSHDNPQETPSLELYSSVNIERPSQAETDPQSPSLPIYSIVQIQRRSQAEAETDPQESPSHTLYSNVHVQRPPQAEPETAVIYATVVCSNEQSLDVNED